MARSRLPGLRREMSHERPVALEAPRRGQRARGVPPGSWPLSSAGTSGPGVGPAQDGTNDRTGRGVKRVVGRKHGWGRATSHSA